MTTDKSGGAAFPHDGVPRNPSMIRRTESSGMSLRDWFAGMAMSGALGGAPGQHLAPHNLAREAYAHADAMIAARAITARQGETK